MLIQKSQENQQILIEKISPELDGGRYPAKRVAGDCFEVQADIFRDGHDLISAALKYRFIEPSASPEHETSSFAPGTNIVWHEVPMTKFDNDRWTGEFPVSQIGRYRYYIEAWNDRFGTWEHDMEKRVQAGVVAASDVLEGVALVKTTLPRFLTIKTDYDRMLKLLADVDAAPDPLTAGALFLATDITEIMNRYPDRSKAATSAELELLVEPERARFAAWYEFFPRSQVRYPRSQRHISGLPSSKLPRVAEMGFDVIYLPPIHPIGRTNRKGPNNTLDPRPNDPGSPWAIGNENGGHKAIEPSLGTFEDFDQFVRAAS